MGVFLILGVLQLLPQPPFIFYFIIIFKKKKDYYLQSHCFGKKLAWAWYVYFSLEGILGVIDSQI